MKRALRILAVLVTLGGLGIWLALGANRGWTKNRVEKKTVDEVTGIEAIAFQPAFKPGLDFIGAAAIGAFALGGASFLFRNDSKTHNT